MLLQQLLHRITIAQLLITAKNTYKYTIASFFRRMVEDIVETCNIENNINNELSWMGTKTSSPKC